MEAVIECHQVGEERWHQGLLSHHAGLARIEHGEGLGFVPDDVRRRAIPPRHGQDISDARCQGDQAVRHVAQGEYGPWGRKGPPRPSPRCSVWCQDGPGSRAIQRDIPVPLIEAGVDKGHLRELAESRLKEKGVNCQCIRCREVGLKGITTFDRQEVELRSESYGPGEAWRTSYRSSFQKKTDWWVL